MSQEGRRQLASIMPCAILLWIAVGCQRPGVIPSSPETGALDRSRAFLKLSQISPHPKFPSGKETPEREPDEAVLRYLNKARDRFDEQLWSEAIAAAEKALQLEPNLIDARLLLARAALRHGNTTLAETQLHEVLRHRPRSATAHQMLGDIAWQDGKATQAIDSLRLALEAGTDTPDAPPRVLAHLTLALALRKEGYLAAAADELEAFLKAVEHPTEAMKAYRELGEAIVLYRGKASGLIGEIQSQLGRHDLAAKAYGQAVAQSPEDTALRTRWARSLARAGRADAALEAARIMLLDAPDEPGNLPLLKDICELAGQPSLYDAELIRLARSSQSKSLRMRLAELLLSRGKVDAAMEALAFVIEANPADAKAACLLAKLHLKRGDGAKAIETLARVLKQQSSAYLDVDAVLADASATERSGMLDAAALQSNDGTAGAIAWYLRGRLLAAQNRTAEAAKAFENSAAADAGFGPAAAALAQVLTDRHDWKGVLAAAENAIKRGASGAEIHLLAGKAHLNLDENEEAEASLLESFRLNPKSAEPLFLLAESAERRGEKKRCEQLFKRILDDVDPRQIIARERLVRLYLNTERLDKAKDYFSDFERLGLTGAIVERTRAMLSLATSNLPSGKARLEEYRKALRDVTERFPHDAQTRIDLAMSYLATSDFDEALAQTDAALAEDGKDARANELKATLLARTLDFAGAAKIVGGLLEERPNDLNYLRKLLDLAINEADWDTVLSLLDTLAVRDELKGSKDLLRRQQIEYLIIADRQDEAVERAKRWLDDAPTEGVRREAYLSALRAAKKDDEAVSSAGEWLSEDPTNTELRVQYIDQLLSANRFVQAQQKVLTWLASDSDDLTLNRMLLTIFWRAKDWEGAIELARTGAELSEHRAQYQGLLGLTYRFARRFDEAVNLYQARAKTAPAEETFDELIAVLVTAERYAEAEQAIHQLLTPQLAHKDAGEQFNPLLVIKLRQSLATIYDMTDRQKAAFEQLREALKLAPGDPELNNNLGFSLADAGVEMDSAEKMIRLAVSEQPRNSAYLDSLGWVLYKRGKMQEAAKYIERSVKFGNDRDPVIFDHWADIMYRLGDQKQAEELWRKSQKMIEERMDLGGTPADKKLGNQVESKLKQLSAHEAVDVAALADSNSTSRPVEKAGATKAR